MGVFKLGQEHGIRFGRECVCVLGGGGGGGGSPTNSVCPSSGTVLNNKGKAFFNLLIPRIFECFLLIVLKSKSPDRYFAFLYDDSMVWKRFPNYLPFVRESTDHRWFPQANKMDL